MATKSKNVRHVAIIMDGNGRWAEQNGVPRAEGHRAGARTVKTALEAAKKFGIEYLTLYAFSTENWKRSMQEVTALMNLLVDFLDENIESMMNEGIRLRMIGRLEDLPSGSRKRLSECIELTKNNTTATLILALSYGGRAELVDAAKKMVLDAQSGKLKADKIDEKCLSNYLYAPDVPDPDLMIRTGGDLRISNFLLWQLAYTEIYVSDLLWPDFDENELGRALGSFDTRERRFGGRNEEKC